MAAPVRQTQERPGLFPRRPLKKAFQKFVAISLYTRFSKSKNSFCSGEANIKIALDFEPRLGGKTGARQRAKKRRRCAANAMGGTSCRPPNGWSKTEKSNLGVSLRFRSNLFYQKFLNLGRLARSTRLPTPNNAPRSENSSALRLRRSYASSKIFFTFFVFARCFF